MRLKVLIIFLSVLVIFLVGLLTVQVVNGRCGILPCNDGMCVLKDDRRYCTEIENPCSLCESQECIFFEGPEVPWVECVEK